MATTLVLFVLDRDARDQADLFMPATDKARAWLAGQGGPIDLGEAFVRPR